MFPSHLYNNMSLSNVKKKLSTGMGILLDSSYSSLNLWSHVCYYLISLSSVKMKLSTKIEILFDSLSSLLNLWSRILLLTYITPQCQVEIEHWDFEVLEPKMLSKRRLNIFSSSTSRGPKLILKADFLRSTI